MIKLGLELIVSFNVNLHKMDYLKGFIDIFFNKKIIFLVFLPVLVLVTVFLAIKIPMSVNAEERQIPLSYQEQPVNLETTVPSTAERIMRTLSQAYPERIGPAVYRDGDWAFQINQRWFFYAEGRLLPEDRKSFFEEYRALGFNSNYLAELPSWESTAEQRAERTRRYEESSNRPPQPAPRIETRQQLSRSLYFTEALWNISNRDQAWRQQVEINFLGHRLTIHSGISQKMRRINEIILNESRTNSSVRQWINSLGTVTGWNWRNVASSGNRSSHSYGISIDILPANLRGQATYWFWESSRNPLWWNIPYTERYHPPDFVVRTFESFGFIWGGKWGNFDTMHFEYRPESFILSNIPLADFRTELQ